MFQRSVLFQPHFKRPTHPHIALSHLPAVHAGSWLRRSIMPSLHGGAKVLEKIAISNQPERGLSSQFPGFPFAFCNEDRTSNICKRAKNRTAALHAVCWGIWLERNQRTFQHKWTRRSLYGIPIPLIRRLVLPVSHYNDPWILLHSFLIELSLLFSSWFMRTLAIKTILLYGSLDWFLCHHIVKKNYRRNRGRWHLKSCVGPITKSQVDNTAYSYWLYGKMSR